MTSSDDVATVTSRLVTADDSTTSVVRHPDPVLPSRSLSSFLSYIATSPSRLIKARSEDSLPRQGALSRSEGTFFSSIDRATASLRYR